MPELLNEACPAGEFLDALEPSDRRKLDVLFQRLGDFGQIRNRERFKKVEGSNGIWEFKSHQIRILCFFARDRRVILTGGLEKKQNRLPPAEVERAESRKAFFESQE